MIGGIFSFLGAALKALPLIFSFVAGRNHARSRSNGGQGAGEG